jgi:hypothetical protein
METRTTSIYECSKYRTFQHGVARASIPMERASFMQDGAHYLAGTLVLFLLSFAYAVY